MAQSRRLKLPKNSRTMGVLASRSNNIADATPHALRGVRCSFSKTASGAFIAAVRSSRCGKLNANDPKRSSGSPASRLHSLHDGRHNDAISVTLWQHRRLSKPSSGRRLRITMTPNFGFAAEFILLKFRGFGRIINRSPWLSAIRGGRSWQSRS